MEINAKLGGTPKKNEFKKVDAVQRYAVTLESVAQHGLQFGMVQRLGRAHDRQHRH